MGLFDAIDVAGSGLAAERLRMDVTAENLANAQTTKGADGQPYRRKSVTLQEAPGASFDEVLGGVEATAIVQDPRPGRRIYDPANPDADGQGYVTLPNVDSVTEMVDLITASRGYDANVQALNAATQMFQKAIDLLR
jgi:flagellar basal-body rod protein FlgC